MEIAFNLWAFYDSTSRVIYNLSGKAYMLDGSERQKLDLLKSLSKSDYLTAERLGLNKRFVVNMPDGSVRRRATLLSVFQDPNAQLFEDVFQYLEKKLPQLPDFTGQELRFVSQSIPDNPLCVTTLLYEDDTGSIRPIINQEDFDWVQHQFELQWLEHLKQEGIVSDLLSDDEDKLEGLIDMQKAQSENSYHLNPPEECDGCGCELQGERFFVDGSVSDGSWANMCPRCFQNYGNGVGWGIGQLYRNMGNEEWLQVAGFEPDC